MKLLWLTLVVCLVVATLAQGSEFCGSKKCPAYHDCQYFNGLYTCVSICQRYNAFTLKCKERSFCLPCKKQPGLCCRGFGRGEGMDEATCRVHCLPGKSCRNTSCPKYYRRGGYCCRA